MKRHRAWPYLCMVLSLMGASVVLPTTSFPVDLKAWDGSINVQTKERFIPVELWAGTEWDGKAELKMPPVNNTYHHRRAQ